MTEQLQTERIVPVHSVRLALYDTDDPSRVLVLSEDDDPDNFKFVGGRFNKVRDGSAEEESPEEAMTRELFEELGLTPEQVGMYFAGRQINQDGVSEAYLFVGRIALATIVLGPGMKEARIVTEDSVPEGKNKQNVIAAIGLTRRTEWRERKALSKV